LIAVGPTLPSELEAITMSILCIDGEISDDELHVWNVAPFDVSVELTCSQVRAVFRGPCLARGVALLGLTPAQFSRLFPDKTQRRYAARLRRCAKRVRGERARDVLAAASWNELHAAAAHDDEDAQIRAAFACALRCRSRRRRRPEERLPL
jgi:hypothetical protein